MPSRTAHEAEAPSLCWVVDVPLLSNPRMLRSALIIAVLAGLLPVLLVAPVLLLEGSAQHLLRLAQLMLAVALGFLVLMLLVMAVVFGNRQRLRFTIDAAGIIQDTVDRPSRLGSRLALACGLLTGSPETAGAGLLALSREREQLLWSGAFDRVKRPFPAWWRAGPLVLSNRWRPLLEIYPSSTNREQVTELIDHYMEIHHPEQRLAPPGALMAALGQSMVVLISCLLVAAAAQQLRLPALPSVLLLAFGFATVWLLPQFAWMVLALTGLILALALAELTQLPLLSEDSVMVALTLLLGCLGLIGFSLRVVRGHWLPMLLRDEQDLGGR